MTRSPVQTLCLAACLSLVSGIVAADPSDRGGFQQVSPEDRPSPFVGAPDGWSARTGWQGNVASVQRTGRGNRSGITQSGRGSRATIRQNGNRNSAEIRQSGDNKQATVIQNGDDTDVTIHQHGDGPGGAIVITW
ncbi:hypothetical protein [Roseovarius salis]|uniref:hypothetical protein n=1 Tax=Roseovarius salis TaxID=3376063 RepID=UPI0037CAA84F